MFYYGLILLIVALVAGVLGLAGTVGAAIGIAKILFFVFVALFAVSLIFNLVVSLIFHRRRSSWRP